MNDLNTKFKCSEKKAIQMMHKMYPKAIGTAEPEKDYVWTSRDREVVGNYHKETGILYYKFKNIKESRNNIDIILEKLMEARND